MTTGRIVLTASRVDGEPPDQALVYFRGPVRMTRRVTTEVLAFVSSPDQAGKGGYDTLNTLRVLRKLF